MFATKRVFGLVASALVLAGLCLIGLGPAQALSPPVESAEIIFSNGGRLVSIKANGSERRILTRPSLGYGNVDQGDSSPAISPDGGRLLFIREDEVTDDIYRADLMVSNRDGSDARSILTTNYGGEGGIETLVLEPAWSPDGSQIYYAEYEYVDGKKSTLATRIVRINADGSGRRVFAQKVIDVDELNRELNGKEFKVRDYWLYTGVDPSPDGSRLLLSSSGLFIFTGLVGKVQTLDLTDGSRSVLAKSSTGASWSIDGSKIVFTSERQRLNKDCYELNCTFDSKVYVMNADGSGQRRLTGKSNRGQEIEPSWSADGSRIVFASDRNYPSGPDPFEVYTVKPDGSCLSWLTNGYPASYSPTWGPEARTTSLGRCGATAGGRPLVTFTPPAKTPAGHPVYWVGRQFRGMLSTYYSGAGSYLEYGDCGYFEPDRCRRQSRIAITSENVCRGPLHWSLQFGEFDSMIRKRGALVARSTKGHRVPDELLVTTGTRTLGIDAGSGTSRSRDFSVHQAVFRALRKVGSSSRVKRFPEARLSRRAVRKAARLAERVENGRSLGTRNLSSKRAYLRFHASIERIGNVKTVPCPGPKKRPGPFPFGPSISVGAFKSPILGRQLSRIIEPGLIGR